MSEKINKSIKKILIITNYKKDFFFKFFKKKNYFDIIVLNLKIKKDFENFLKLNQKFDYLISFASGYIFKKKFLSNFKKSFNFHPGLPEYRGRDVHHFACLNKEKYHGGTLHLISEKIDAGRILFVHKKKINKQKYYHEYFRKVGIECLKFIFKKKFNSLFKKKNITFKKVLWGKKLYTRKMFLENLEVKQNISYKQYLHLLKSFHNSKFPSLYIKNKNKKIFLKSKKDYKKIKQYL